MTKETPPQQSNNKAALSMSAVLLAVLLAVIVYSALNRTAEKNDIGFGEMINAASAGQIETIEVRNQDLTITYVAEGDADPVLKNSQIGKNVDIAAYLADQGIAPSRDGAAPGAPAVNLVFDNPAPRWWSGLLSLAFTMLPLLLIAGFFLFVFRRAAGGSSQMMDFGKSHARMVAGNTVTVTFADVAGVDEAKEDLAEVVEFLRNPEKFLALGAHIPKGVLLVGPPGTGKTLLARAVAGQAEVPFFSISASEFVEMFVGVGASRVRDLFTEAKRNAPCIVFLDEIDAVGRQRGAGLGGGNDEREQTLNQVLVEMDGFEADTHVIVLAATNRPDILDPALLRPGRFDRKVILDNPDVKGREAILNVHVKGKPIEPDVSISELAKTTPGFSGADLANLVNEAAMLAARNGKNSIGTGEFGEALDRVIAGPQRKSRVMTPHEKRLMAFHEGGHAVVAHFMAHHDPPQKVTIVSHGLTGGYTRFLPDEETHFRTPSMLRDQLCAALGGRAAEQLEFGEASTGPANDIEQATALARAMVTRWGMSERLGPRTFGRSEELVFLGRQISETRDYSEKFAEEIDNEVRSLIKDAQERAHQVLVTNRALLDRLVEALLDAETLEGDRLRDLLNSSEGVAAQIPSSVNHPSATEPVSSALPLV